MDETIDQEGLLILEDLLLDLGHIQCELFG
jgi:hypothetical protein